MTVTLDFLATHQILTILVVLAHDVTERQRIGLDGKRDDATYG